LALTFDVMLTMLYARGFDFLNDGGAGATRAARFVNDAMHQIDDMEPWQYLQASTTGTSPLTISDLGRIESVTDVANLNDLAYMPRQNVTTLYADLTLTSSVPTYYYVTGGTVVNTFPVSGVTLTARYFKVAADLTGTQAPSMPDRFRMAIVHYAAQLAFAESNIPDEAQLAGAAGDAVVERMREWNLLSQGSGGQQLVTWGTSQDW
jgi:hypothetical protein